MLHWFQKHKGKIIDISVLLLVILLGAHFLFAKRIKNQIYKAHFETVLQNVDTYVPAALKEALKGNEWVIDVSVSMDSSLVDNERHNWFEWEENLCVTYRVKDEFDELPNLEKYYIIAELGEQVEPTKKQVAREIVPNYERYSNLEYLSDNAEMLEAVYGKRVVQFPRHTVLLVTENNEYRYTNFKYFIVQNGIEIEIPELIEAYRATITTPEPYPGMSEVEITQTKLGCYSSFERCASYDALRPDHQMTTYYWKDKSGKVYFEVDVLNKKVISTVDYREKPMKTRNIWDE